MPSAATRFCRYMPSLGGMVPSPSAEPFRIHGFSDECLLFTCQVSVDGRTLYQAFEGRSGNSIGKPELTRGTAAGAARGVWEKAGQAELDGRVAKALKDREAQNG